MKFKQLTNKVATAVNAIALVVTMGAVMAPRDALAGLGDAMSEMFLVSGTDAQMINTQRLRGFYGGSLSVRSPGRSIEIAQFARPRIDAGCGGVDIFFGSFSFINGAQFEQMIRSIAANATGYMIKNAIGQMCDPCKAIITELEGAIRELNALAKNTCAISMQSITATMDKLAEHGRKIGETISVAVGKNSDSAAATSKSVAEKPSETAKGGGDALAEENPMYGNLVARAAAQSMSSGANTLRSFMSQTQITEVVQSVFGTTIINPDVGGGGTCPAGTSAERCDSRPIQWPSTIATWDKLMRPRSFSPNGMDILRCLNPSSCTRVSKSTMSLSEWGGVEDWVNEALFGTTSPAGTSTYSDSSLIGAFVNKRGIDANGSNLSSKAKALLQIAPVPVIPLLLETQKSPGAAQMIGLILAQHMPRYFEYVLGVEIINIASNTFANQTEVSMPDEFRQRLESMNTSLALMRPNANSVHQMLEGTMSVIKHSQTLVTSPVRSGGAQR